MFSNKKKTFLISTSSNSTPNIFLDNEGLS